MSASDGMNYAPKGKPQPVVQPGEFSFAAVALDHGHINGMCNALTEAGAELRWIHDSDPARSGKLQASYPNAKIARSLDEILDDPAVKLVSAAAVPCDRGPLGIKVMEAGKDYFTDKTPFTSLDQLAAARKSVQATGQKYMVYYSERLHVECAVAAGELIAEGAIGTVLNVIGMGPHRLSAAGRPAWFFERAKYGGILCDIGSHQIEQFLFFSGAHDAEVVSASVGNFRHPDYPELEDFGDAHLIADNGATNYYRVDWFTPDGLGTWGDGRTVILGTEGYIELRKYIDVARHPTGNHLYMVNAQGEQHLDTNGRFGYPFFGRFILDCLHRSENAMTQAHAFKAAELCLECQDAARVVSQKD